MKVSELKRVLTYVGDDDDIEFHVSTKGPTYVAKPTHAQITTKWKIPDELSAIPDDLPKTVAIHLEI